MNEGVPTELERLFFRE